MSNEPKAQLTPWDKICRMALHYYWGCFSKAINGANSALFAFIGLSVGSVQDPSKIPAPSVHVLGWVFATQFIVSALAYFKDHPLPDDLPVIDEFFPAAPAQTQPRVITTTTTEVEK